MHTNNRIMAAAAASVFFAAFAPTAAHAQTPGGSLSACIEIACGNKEVFLACVGDMRESLQKEFDLPNGWFERLSSFVEEHPDWAVRMRGIVDRLEDRWDRREDRRDGREDWRDSFENRCDRAEDILDRWEDRHDEDTNLEDLFDRLEDRRDNQEDRRDRRENRFDRRENFRDRFEDWRDDLWTPGA